MNLLHASYVMEMQDRNTDRFLKMNSNFFLFWEGFQPANLLNTLVKDSRHTGCVFKAEITAWQEAVKVIT